MADFSTGELPRLNFTMKSGDYSVIEVTVKDEDGAAFNITGMIAKWGLYTVVEGTETLIKQTGGSGISIVDGPNGRLDITLDGADTAALEGRYYHELEIIDGSSRPKTVMEGEVKITPDRVNA